MKLAELIVKTIKELGVDSIFGVPDNYTLKLCDYIEDAPDIEWMATNNELNASYAADGYAKVKGLGVLCTTYAVGELSAANGIAGSYAEGVPVIHLVGMPPLKSVQQKNLHTHHTYGDGEYDRFYQMAKKITCASTLLNSHNIVAELGRVISAAIVNQRPVYIGIPSDLYDLELADDTKIVIASKDASKGELPKDLVKDILSVLKSSRRPVAWLGYNTKRNNSTEKAYELINKLKIPYAQSNMGKSLYPENHPLYLGVYQGQLSHPFVVKAFDEADAIIKIGVNESDFNTGIFTQKQFDKSIQINGDINEESVLVNDTLYSHVNTSLLIMELLAEIKNLNEYDNGDIVAQRSRDMQVSDEWSTDYFWDKFSKYVKEDDTVVVEIGMSALTFWDKYVPVKYNLVTSAIWCAIGYALPAAFGAAAAKKDKRTLLLIGDGSFLMTAQALSSIVRHNQQMTIFLMNNEGYGIERAIHGPMRKYNDIAQWDFRAFAKAVGKNINTYLVEDKASLSETLDSLPSQGVNFVEVKLSKEDMPSVVQRLGDMLEQQNG